MEGEVVGGGGRWEEAGYGSGRFDTILGESIVETAMIKGRLCNVFPRRRCIRDSTRHKHKRKSCIVESIL